MHYLIYKLAYVCILATALLSCRGNHDKSSGSALKIIDGHNSDAIAALPLVNNGTRNCSGVLVEDNQGNKFFVTALHCLADKKNGTYSESFDSHFIYPSVSPEGLGLKMRLDPSRICYNQNFFKYLSTNELSLQSQDGEHHIIGEAAAYDLAVINVSDIYPFKTAKAYQLATDADMTESESYLRKPPRNSIPEYIYNHFRPHIEGLVAGWGAEQTGNDIIYIPEFRSKFSKATPADNHGLFFGFNSMASGDSGAPLIVRANERPLESNNIGEDYANEYLKGLENKVFAIGVTSNHRGSIPYNFSVDLTSLTSIELFEKARSHTVLAGKSCTSSTDGKYDSSFLSRLTIDSFIDGLGSQPLDKLKGSKPALFPIGNSRTGFCQGVMINAALYNDSTASNWFVTPKHCIAGASSDETTIDSRILKSFCENHKYLDCDQNFEHRADFASEDGDILDIAFIKVATDPTHVELHSIYSGEEVSKKAYFATYAQNTDKRSPDILAINYADIEAFGAIDIWLESSIDECYLEGDLLAGKGPFVWHYNSETCRTINSYETATPLTHNDAQSGGVFFDAETGDVLCMVVREEEQQECIDLTKLINQ